MTERDIRAMRAANDQANAAADHEADSAASEQASQGVADGMYDSAGSDTNSGTYTTSGTNAHSGTNEGTSRISAPASPLISVIVPMFNVAPYARECVMSLLAMQPIDVYADDPTGAAAEIIIIDDGSTDGTAAILDDIDARFQQRQPQQQQPQQQQAQRPPNRPPQWLRLRVVHTVNQGLSAARNLGVQLATGRYVTFVDGDDKVRPNYLTSLWHGLTALGGVTRPLVIGTSTTLAHDAEADEQEAAVPRAAVPCTVVTPDEAMTAILAGRLSMTAWGKLASRDFYLTHPFSTGRVYEDLESIAPLVVHADRVATLAEPIYWYRMRSDSLSHPAHPTRRHVDDFARAIDLFAQSCALLFADRVPASLLAYQQSVQYMRLHRLLRAMGRHGGQQPQQESERESAWRIASDRQVVNQVRLLSATALNAPVSSTARLRLRLFLHCRWLYDLAFDWRDRLTRQ